MTFYPIHAYGWLDADGARTWVRYIFRATATRADRLDEGFSGQGPARRGDGRPARARPGHPRGVGPGRGRRPRPAPRHRRSGQGARELLAGRIVVTAAVDDPEGGPMSSTPTVFDPTRVVDGIELSDDPILRYRPGAYSESVVPAHDRPPSLRSVKTLVIGTGGREHALARALAARPGRHRGARGARQPGDGRGRDAARRRPAGRSPPLLLSPTRSASTWSWSARRRRWSPAWPTRCGPPGSRCSARPRRRPGSRGRRRSPRRSWPRPASRPLGRSSAPPPTRSPPRWTSSGRRTS